MGQLNCRPGVYVFLCVETNHSLAMSVPEVPRPRCLCPERFHDQIVISPLAIFMIQTKRTNFHSESELSPTIVSSNNPTTEKCSNHGANDL